MIVTRQQILDKLAASGLVYPGASGFYGFVVGSERFFCPNRKFMDVQFREWIEENLPVRFADIDKFNCQSFAAWALVELHKCISVNHEISGCSVAAGQFLLSIGMASELNGIANEDMGPSGHATILSMYDDGELYCYEPQTQKDCGLKEAQDNGAIGAVSLVYVW